MQLAPPDAIDIVAASTLAEAVAVPALVGPTVARLAEALAQADLICVALDEPRAQALASAAPHACVKAGLADGSIGVVIGTQALAADSVGFADLALVIIDDEQRFGAAADELEDRFGTLPESAQRLIATARIRRLACAAHIARIDADPKAIALTPRPDFASDAANLEAKGDRLLLRGDPGPDPFAATVTLLERLIPA